MVVLVLGHGKRTPQCLVLPHHERLLEVEGGLTPMSGSIPGGCGEAVVISEALGEVDVEISEKGL